MASVLMVLVVVVLIVLVAFLKLLEAVLIDVFLLLTETTGGILKTSLRSLLKIVHCKNVSYWYQMNPKVFSTLLHV